MGKIDQGKAFEYACITALEEAIKTRSVSITPSIRIDSPYLVAQTNFNALNSANPSHANDLLMAGKRLSEILYQTEPKLYNLEALTAPTVTLAIQPDAAGITGDVRDVIAIKASSSNQTLWEIGISCKHNHNAVKHPRISPTIDFGTMWLDMPLDEADYANLTEIFDQVDADRSLGHTAWSQVARKDDRYYVPILQLVMDKINSHPDKERLAEHLLKYLMGNKDFYKVIYSRNRTIHLQGFNFNGTLNRPADTVRSTLTVNRLHFPSRIISLGFKPGSKNTIEIFFDRGWQVSMRVHSASTNLEKSLKMDVRLDGAPHELFNFSQDV